MADASVALVASMHPAVISFWLLTEDLSNQTWEEQRNAVFASAIAGEWWGTMTSEPGSGGDLARTRASAARLEGAGFLTGHRYAVAGHKNLGSGLGIPDRMMACYGRTAEKTPENKGRARSSVVRAGDS
jgi:alkylation response protein AidB-like acyl-CoA dehydrogenase